MIKPTRRSVFFISDGTGISAETLGLNLLAHFPGVEFHQVRMPFIDSPEKARACLPAINKAAQEDGLRPILLMTFVNEDVSVEFCHADALCLDFFKTFIGPLGQELGMLPTRSIGQGRRVVDNSVYRHRMEAVNYSLEHDDGASERHLSEAEVILVGVSRSGKTPTSLYLAMQFGIRAANYPLIPEDFERGKLPSVLDQYRKKLFGLTIRPERLHEIRSERRPNSKYASLDNCRLEVKQAEQLMHRENIRWLDSTTRSIEEIAAKVMQECGLDGHVG
ncbi:[pyruvate, water dikinase]-phosphate phosphotransferase / [pyruvate, water dikinase] kinase [Novimethylophilus kurashikiensis]|uniref:Putative phosphoenolpyruvate synthase regulatory protein n=1 Tax=Novimethylophilus kurashikiensis TaxID=1825523 RepID=A0A2R5F749_9PROT|nr:pyruvate, water dikinase regulatory protein [Novimethylophilus kurashikiensis]GBG14017.1 [pyruvate, water dikinase]-phosphate phosphotransferase / [pyruvate, water dikinase] kinase [Novimethylophilus kurashikiensis]